MDQNEKCRILVPKYAAYMHFPTFFSDFIKQNFLTLALRTTVVDTPYRGGYYANVVGVPCLKWWIRHTEAGIILTWWGIMLDVVDTPYRGGYYVNVVGYYA